MGPSIWDGGSTFFQQGTRGNMSYKLLCLGWEWVETESGQRSTLALLKIVQLPNDQFEETWNSRVQMSNGD